MFCVSTEVLNEHHVFAICRGVQEILGESPEELKRTIDRMPNSNNTDWDRARQMPLLLFSDGDYWIDGETRYWEGHLPDSVEYCEKNDEKRLNKYLTQSAYRTAGRIWGRWRPIQRSGGDDRRNAVGL